MRRSSTSSSDPGERRPSVTKPVLRIGFTAVVLTAVVLSLAAIVYEIDPATTVGQLTRIMARPVLGYVHRADLDEAEALGRRHTLGLRGAGDLPEESWERFSDTRPNVLYLVSYSGAVYPDLDPPFVFEDFDADHIASLRQQMLRLGIAQNRDQSEFDSMMEVAAWVGGLWDHGSDVPPGGFQGFVLPDLIDDGSSGSYSCEVAARSMSQAATAMGWASRVLTISRNGYDWNHGVTELWSNEFAKWFIVDTDFNVVYLSDGVPLSGYELIHEGAELRDQGRLVVSQFAVMKPFFLRRWGVQEELEILRRLPLYRYAHTSLRNDWVTRSLPAGSPAGGDGATLYTSSEELPPILTAIDRVDSKTDFDWPLNLVEVRALDFQPTAGGGSLKLGFFGFGPYASGIEVRLDGRQWAGVQETVAYELGRGAHTIEARLVVRNGLHPGPSTVVTFEIERAGR